MSSPRQNSEQDDSKQKNDPAMHDLWHFLSSILPEVNLSDLGDDLKNSNVPGPVLVPASLPPPAIVAPPPPASDPIKIEKEKKEKSSTALIATQMQFPVNHSISKASHPVEKYPPKEQQQSIKGSSKQRERPRLYNKDELPLIKKTTEKYTPQQKQEAIKRYREKRKKRVDGNRILYGCRQDYALKRPRVKGQFITHEAAEKLGPAGFNYTRRTPG